MHAVHPEAPAKRISDPTAAVARAPSAALLADWTYIVLPSTGSTNTDAARLPAWTAVRAETQSAGRGRTLDRVWVSDRGGLWLSAVLPCPAPRSRWETLPLAAGWAVVKAVTSLGVPDARLRWPNDVMVGDSGKLAGLLVERHTADTAVVGIGLNVYNRPERVDAALAGHAVALDRWFGRNLTLDEVAEAVLRALRAAHQTLLGEGFAPIGRALNDAWAGPRTVEVTFNAHRAPVRCEFHGVDAEGRLRLRLASGLQTFSANDVALFREVPPALATHV